MNSSSTKEIVLLGITGASGMLYLESFLRIISALPVDIHGICSASGKKVLRHELDMEPSSLTAISQWFDADDMTAPPASGSSRYLGMVILPCTMSSLAAIAAGLSVNLIHRAADVMLKERRPLLLAVRETPFNRTHLHNMLQAHDAGAVICPPMPGFYLKPKNLAEAADTFSWRLADQLGLDVNHRQRWQGVA